ncbi:predicted protein [Botrytis cinerea T4]|uniref:Uncharacterized protein n=1 Tax=Botryotinia fuckeliana (strain T4) TaxID=999810 RepID=G2YSR6_BOTF4|nr:predicted protein [Botrytis cinerea T4]
MPNTCTLYSVKYVRNAGLHTLEVMKPFLWDPSSVANSFLIVATKNNTRGDNAVREHTKIRFK